MALDGLGALGEQPEVRGIPEQSVTGVQAPEGGHSFEDRDLQAHGGQRPVDDGAVLGREPPRGEKAPPGKRQHHPDHEGGGQEQLVAQAERGHGKTPPGADTSRVPGLRAPTRLQNACIGADLDVRGLPSRWRRRDPPRRPLTKCGPPWLECATRVADLATGRGAASAGSGQARVPGPRAGSRMLDFQKEGPRPSQLCDARRSSPSDRPVPGVLLRGRPGRWRAPGDPGPGGWHG